MESSSTHNKFYYNELVTQVQVKVQPHSPSSSQASFSILALAIIGILTIAFLLIGYYVFAIKCCLNSRRIDILSPFFISRSRRREAMIVYSPTIETRGLEASEIRAIPILQFKKVGVVSERSSMECAVCLSEFREEEKLRVLPVCAHVFHIDCIDVWLQSNANCPLCRSSVSISISTRLPDQINAPPTSFQEGDNVVSESRNFVVIEVRNGDLVEQPTREMPNSDVSISIRPISPSPRKTEHKTGNKKPRRVQHVSSMGDECINVRPKDEQFAVQPIRRSISMDSSTDRQLILSIQEIIQQNKHLNEETGNEGCGSSGATGANKLRRSIFSFRGSRNAVLPTQFEWH